MEHPGCCLAALDCITRHCMCVFFMRMCRGCLDFCWLCSSFPLKAGGFAGTREMEETPGRMRGTAALPLSSNPVKHQGHHCHQELPDRKPLPVLEGRSLSSITCWDVQWADSLLASAPEMDRSMVDPFLQRGSLQIVELKFNHLWLLKLCPWPNVFRAANQHHLKNHWHWRLLKILVHGNKWHCELLKQKTVILNYNYILQILQFLLCFY